MSRKSMLFTVTTILLFISILLFSSAYLARNQDILMTATSSMAGGRLRYIEDDITGSIYEDLIGLNVSMLRQGDYVTVTIREPDISFTEDQEEHMADYRSFAETTYAEMNNIDIILSGFNSSFRIMPYNAERVREDSVYYLYIEDITALENISVEAEVSETRAAENNASPAEDPGGKLIVVRFYQNSSEIYSESRNQDPSETNSEFYQTFLEEGPPVEHDASAIYVQFGSYGGHDGILRIWAENLSGNITRLDITYNGSATDTRITGGNISISSPAGNISKTAEIVLAQE